MNRTYRTLLIGGFLALAGAAAPQPAEAHPHVWVETSSELVFKDGVLGAVRHVWTFDDMFSSYAAQGLDTDGDGKLTREELQPLAQVNVELLREYDFFTYLKVGSYDAHFLEPVDYWLEDVGGRLTLHFTLPIEAPMLVGDRQATLEIYDPTFFVDFTFAGPAPVAMAGAPAGCRLAVSRAGDLDPAVAAKLADIPADVREIPGDLYAVTSANANRATVTCG